MSYPYEAYDVMVIGGGINGIGIAAEAASRGLKTVLLEQGDFACGTSSNSTQLIHGGLRYLEQGHFSLVKESLNEQNILLKRAPHLVRPIPIVIPLVNKRRSFWKLRSGLFLYDAFSPAQNLPGSRTIELEEAFPKDTFQYHLSKGLCFFDATTDDARLALANALWAKQHGATLYNYHQVYHVDYDHYHWTVRVRHGLEHHTLRSKVLINATGRWITQIPTDLKRPVPEEIEWVQGIHLVIPRLYPGNHATLLQAEDHRIVFVVPYGSHSHMIGTTDLRLPAHEQSAPTAQEQEYLLKLISEYFKKPIHSEQILHKKVGVRTLLASNEKNASEVSREYQLRLHTHVDHPPIMHVIGGKMTTYRALSQKAIKLLENVLPILNESLSAQEYLPGGDFEAENIDKWIHEQQTLHPHLPAPLIQRWCQSYGKHCLDILDGRRTIPDLGKHFGADVYQAEIEYLMKWEWIRYFQDLMWRRTKFGLSLNTEQQSILKDWVSDRYGVV